ncbi:MAG: ferredoxin [Lentilitoribacter sp.]
MSTLLQNIDADLSAFGLKIRSVKVFEEPTNIECLEAKSVALIGHIGSEHWDYFESWWSQGQNKDLEHPLDEWSKWIIKPLAHKFQGVAVFPSDEPYYPFQNWALDSDNLSSSKINILINEDIGTWHGYRGALAFDVALDAQSSSIEASNLCATCVDKPCISACPVNAFGSESFLYSGCQSYLATQVGETTCMEHGCAARNACPYGVEHKYKSPHMKFHMRAFRK